MWLLRFLAIACSAVCLFLRSRCPCVCGLCVASRCTATAAHNAPHARWMEPDCNSLRLRRARGADRVLLLERAVLVRIIWRLSGMDFDRQRVSLRAKIRVVPPAFMLLTVAGVLCLAVD